MPSRPATLTGTLRWESHYPDQGLPEAPEYPDQGLPYPPPRPDQGLPPFATQLPIWVTDGEGHPSHPIVLPDPPRPSHPIHYPVFPSHPIWIASPGRPTHPIALPPGVGPVPPMEPGGSPSHPIVLPPPTPDSPGTPTHPIVLPIAPGSLPEGMDLYYSPQIGYFTAVLAGPKD